MLTLDSMMILEDALIDAGYDSTWGIYARKINGRFELDSPARYGQLIFENGGRLDDFEFVCRCDYPSDARVKWLDGADEDGDWDDGFLEELIEQLNA